MRKTGVFLVFMLTMFLGYGQAAGTLGNDPLMGWQLKDWETDSLPGIGLERAIAEGLTTSEGQEVLVALLDTKIDIHHEQLQGHLWTNTDEVPGNGVDDDNNGYIDDIHGWNFLGNDKGEDVFYQISEWARFAQLKARLDTIALRAADPDAYQTISQYASEYHNNRETLLEQARGFDSLEALYRSTTDTLGFLLGQDRQNRAVLDSLVAVRPGLSPYVQHYKDFVLEYDISEETMDWNRSFFQVQREFYFNPDYNERAIPGDDPGDLSDRVYGNPILDGRVPFEHAIQVAGILVGSREKGLGLERLSSLIRIMPVVMVAEGTPHDKDIALAIRYAVDNGARIINISWGKSLSMHPQWVREAIEYAASHNVLLVASSGNQARDIDASEYYPLDYTPEGEFVQTFIKVGGLVPEAGPGLVASFSNYGARNVDLFAPAEHIWTTDTGNAYKVAKGTSLAAPLVAQTAALIMAYYPGLSAAEVKEIVLESATRLDMEVYKPDAEEGAARVRVPFSSLSRTGGILNARRAFQLAAERQ